MEALKELVYLVSKNKIKSIKILGSEPPEDSKVASFYEHLIGDDFSSDEEAADYFYPSKEKSGKSSYRNLKSRLKTRLINTLFFLDAKQPSYSDRQKAYYNCYKEWAAAKILLGRNARAACIELSHKILTHAERYEFTELCLDIYRTLRLHYGAREGDLKLFEFYKEKYNAAELLDRAENKAEELYTDLISRFVNDKSSKEISDQEATPILQQVDVLEDQFDSYKVCLYGSLIKLVIYSSKNDYHNTLRVCKNSIRVFESKEYTAKTPLQIFYYQELVCYTHLRAFAKGKAAAERCLKFLDEGTFNWFKYYELYFTLSMYTKQYQDAYQIFDVVINHKRFDFLPDNIKEMWNIYRAYLHYLVDLDKVRLKPDDNRFSKFRLGRFLNETPIFSKDKRGMNISILIIQTLFQILQKNYSAAIDSIEAIEKYRYRYLNKKETLRSYYFIKMLLTVPMASFHKAAVIRKATPHLKKLKRSSVDLSDRTHDVEIIPFEDLWELALHSLENTFYRKRKKSKKRSSSRVLN